MKFEFRHWSFNVKKSMALKDVTPITGWEKWINRIATAAIAVWQLVQYLLTHWASSPPTV